MIDPWFGQVLTIETSIDFGRILSIMMLCVSLDSTQNLELEENLKQKLTYKENR